MIVCVCDYVRVCGVRKRVFKRLARRIQSFIQLCFVVYIYHDQETRELVLVVSYLISNIINVPCMKAHFKGWKRRAVIRENLFTVRMLTRQYLSFLPLQT